MPVGDERVGISDRVNECLGRQSREVVAEQCLRLGTDTAVIAHHRTPSSPPHFRYDPSKHRLWLRSELSDPVCHPFHFPATESVIGWRGLGGGVVVATDEDALGFQQNFSVPTRRCCDAVPMYVGGNRVDDRTKYSNTLVIMSYGEGNRVDDKAAGCAVPRRDVIEH